MMMTYKNILIILWAVSTILTTAVQASEETEDLYLVVGSTRKQGQLSSILAKKYGSEVDCSHRKTFDGRATSLDIYDVEIQGLPHIKADVLTYRPENKQKIRAAFMELLPSSIIPGVQGSFSRAKRLNPEDRKKHLAFMPNAIRNLAQYMPEGATLDIEHDPYLTISSDLSTYHRARSELVSLNPFHGFVPLLFMNSMEVSFLSDDVCSWYWSCLHGNLNKLGYPDDLIQEFITASIQDLESTKSAISSVKQALGLTDEGIKKLIDADLTYYKKHGFNSDAFQITMIIMSEFIMFSRQEAMKSFLTSVGFINTTIKRLDKNPYNGRKNTWMISCVKGK